ncbi:MAG: hypothetical protein ACREQ9_19195 [Candidatus Binatia bacterium]
MRRLLALSALLALASPATARAQVPLVSFTYYVEGCGSGTGLLFQPVSVCGHVFQAVTGIPDLLQRVVVNVTLGSAVTNLRFGAGAAGVNVGFSASGASGNTFQIHLATTTLVGCQRSGSVTFANPAQLSADPRIHGIVATRGSTFSASDPFYIEGPLVTELAPGASESLLFDLDNCIPGQFELHVERLDRLSSLVGSFGSPALEATMTGLPRVVDLLYRDTPAELLLDLSHDSTTLAGVFAFPDGGTLTIGRTPRMIAAQVSRDGAGSVSGVAVAFTNTPAGGALFQYDGSVLGEVSSLGVDRITSAGILADLVQRRFSMGDAGFTGGPATFGRREGTLLVASGGPGASHSIDVEATALSIFEASVDAAEGVAVTLDHDGLLDAAAELPSIGSFAIGRIQSAGFFVDPAIPAFVLEDAGRSGGFATFDGRAGTLAVDLETTDGLRADVVGTAMDRLRALVDVEDEVNLLVDHAGRLDVDVEAPSLGRFQIVRLPAHLAGRLERDAQGDLSRLRVEASGGTLQSRITATTSVAGSSLDGTLGAILGGVLDLDRATDLASLEIDFATNAGDLSLDLAGTTDGQDFDAATDGFALTDLSLLMSLDTSQKVDVELDHLGTMNLDVEFPDLAQVTATSLPRHVDFETRRAANGDLSVVDLALAQGSGDSQIGAWADLDDVSFFARIDDIAAGDLLADLASDRIDVDFAFATPNGFVEVDGHGNFDGDDVSFTLSSADLRRARMDLANSGPLTLGANGSRTGSHLTLDIVLNFLGIDIEFGEGAFFDPAKVQRRSDGRYDLVFPANSDEVASEGECRTKGIPPDTIFTDPEIDLQLCALRP